MVQSRQRTQHHPRAQGVGRRRGGGAADRRRALLLRPAGLPRASRGAGPGRAGRPSRGDRRPRAGATGRDDPEPAVRRPPPASRGVSTPHRSSGRVRRRGRAVRCARPPRPRLRHRDGAGHQRPGVARRRHPVRSRAVLLGARREDPLRPGRGPMGARRPSGRRRRILRRAGEPQGELHPARAARQPAGGGGSAGRRRPRRVHGGAHPRHACWRGPEIRRTLLYKYSPGSSTWAEDQRWPATLLEQLTERQRLLLQPPSVAYHEPVI